MAAALLFEQPFSGMFLPPVVSGVFHTDAMFTPDILRHAGPAYAFFAKI